MLNTYRRVFGSVIKSEYLNLVEENFDEDQWPKEVEKEAIIDITHPGAPRIFSVPQTLMNDNPEAYIPQIVSLGPYHFGKPELRAMEKHKSEAVRRIQRRIRPTNFTVIVEKIKSMEPKIRRCYDRDIAWNGKTLSWMMARDGSFLLEFLRFYARNPEDLPVSSDCHPIFGKNSSLETKGIREDAVKLENQIPLFVLKEILTVELRSEQSAKETLAVLVRFFCVWGTLFSVPSGENATHYRAATIMEIFHSMAASDWLEDGNRNWMPDFICNYVPCIAKCFQHNDDREKSGRFFFDSIGPPKCEAAVSELNAQEERVEGCQPNNSRPGKGGLSFVSIKEPVSLVAPEGIFSSYSIEPPRMLAEARTSLAGIEPNAEEERAAEPGVSIEEPVSLVAPKRIFSSYSIEPPLMFDEARTSLAGIEPNAEEERTAERIFSSYSIKPPLMFDEARTSLAGIEPNAEEERAAEPGVSIEEPVSLVAPKRIFSSYSIEPPVMFDEARTSFAGIEIDAVQERGRLSFDSTGRLGCKIERFLPNDAGEGRADAPTSSTHHWRVDDAAAEPGAREGEDEKGRISLDLPPERAVKFKRLKELKHPEILPRAVELKKTGVKFKPFKGSISNIQFKKRSSTLHLPVISAGPLADTMLRNLAAFECSSASSSDSKLPITRYVQFMDELIDNEMDVALLRENGIVRSPVGRDTLIAELFNPAERIALYANYDRIDNARQGLLDHQRRTWKIGVYQFYEANCSKSWLVISGLAACALIAMTFLQVLCLFVDCNPKHRNLYH